MEEKTSAPILRIPATLMPSYKNAMSTEDGKQAPKRVRVNCGVCDKIRYYSIHRGVTRIHGIIACEACRHCYQKFKRQPCILSCSDGGSCYVLGDNSRNRCRACWIGHILTRCPVPGDLYQNFISHLPKEIQERMPPAPPVIENLPESKKGALGLEYSRNGEWVDATVTTAEDSGVDQFESFEANFDGDSSTEASLGHNPDHFSGNSETGDSEPSHANEGDIGYVDASAVQWWMQSNSQGGYTVSGSTSNSNQTYFNMGNMNPTSGLTTLTSMQNMDGLQPLTPLTPVQQYSQDQQPQANGFHDLLSLVNIKQEPEPHSLVGASEEARLFQSISVKQEFYPHHTPTEVQIPINTSQYFEQTEMEKEAPLDIKFVTRDHELYNSQNGWSMQNNSQEMNDESVKSENSSQSKKQTKSPKAKKDKNDANSPSDMGADGAPPPTPEKQRRKVDRFNGIPLEEVAKKFLPDHLALNLDILIIGINPGLYAAHVGHHYAGPGNHFWKCMYLSGIIPEPFNAYDDHRMLQYGIGFTNVVARTTRSSTDLSKKEMKEGSEILRAKLQQYRPRIAVFNGKTIYEMYSGKKQFAFGKQPEKVEGTDTYIWVMPSSSARCAQLPRALDKVPFYSALRKLLDYLTGRIQDLDEAEVIFNVKLTNAKKVPKPEPVKPEPDQESRDDDSDPSANVIESSTDNSPSKGRLSPQKRKSEQTVKSKKK